MSIRAVGEEGVTPPLRYPSVTLRGFKGDVVLTWQLVYRHRAPRWALVFVFVILVLVTLGEIPGSEGAVLLSAGTFGSVAGSRLLARGGALELARSVARPAWVLIVGRWLGLVLAAIPVAAAGAVVSHSPFRLTAAALSVAAVHGGVTMALAPITGASAAAAIGFSAALMGGITPAGVGLMLDGTGPVRTVVMAGWGAAPLTWRAVDWIDGRSATLFWLVAVWVVLAGAGAAVRLTWPWGGGRT